MKNEQDGSVHRLMEESRAHLLEAGLSTSSEFDRAILTLSSAGLALSLVIAKDFARPSSPATVVLICAAWVLFLVAIASTTVGFLLSRKAIDEELRRVTGFLVHDGIDALPNRWSNRTGVANFVSATAFVLATVALVFYGMIHIAKQEVIVTAEQVKGLGTSASGNQGVGNGVGDLQRGYVPPRLPLPQTTPQSSPQPSTGGTAQSGDTTDSGKK